MRLDRDFYAQDTVEVARQLLGKKLVRKIGKTTLSGIITETEAYRQSDDPASHAYRGITPRNRAMFESVGCAYVYFTYGMYHCVNVVARNKRHSAGAVLIRALQPKDGIDIMMKNRKTEKIENLTSGPGKLTIALDITKKQYGEDLVNSDSLFITEGITISKIISGPRIGIKSGTDKKWNFRI
ncbi:MAG: DNA-3-methyladenine glycosylase [Candidatus Nitrosotenuis sp.]